VSDDDQKSSTIEQIFERFAGILEKQGQRTDKKLGKLTDSITELTIAHIESKKDREYDSSRMERIEKIQDDQAVIIRALSSTSIKLEERVSSNKSKLVMAAQTIATMVASVVAAVVIVGIK